MTQRFVYFERTLIDAVMPDAVHAQTACSASLTMGKDTKVFVSDKGQASGIVRLAMFDLFGKTFGRRIPSRPYTITGIGGRWW
jgi:hypothetical protein